MTRAAPTRVALADGECVAGPHLLLVDADATQTALADALVSAGFEISRVTTPSEVPPELKVAAAVVNVGAHRPNPSEVGALCALAIPVIAVCPREIPGRADGLAMMGVTRVVEPGPDVPAAIKQILAGDAKGLQEDERVGAIGPGVLAQLIQQVGERQAVFAAGSNWDDIGVVWLRDGLVVDAQLGVLPPVRAFERLFTLDHGGYFARIGQHDHEEALLIDAAEAVSEALARAAIWRRCVRDMGGLRRVYRVERAVLDAMHDGMPDQAGPLLELVDGVRTLRAVIDDSVYDELHTLPVLQRLHLAGVLVPVGLPEHPEDTDEIIEALDGELMEFIPPEEGPIPVVRFESRRGTRLLALEKRSLESRLSAAERGERPLLLTDMVVPPGGVTIPVPVPETSEILASAPNSPLAPTSPDLRTSHNIAMLGVAAVVVSVVAFVYASTPRPAPPSSLPSLPEAVAAPAPPPPTPVAVAPPPPVDPTPAPAPVIPPPPAKTMTVSVAPLPMPVHATPEPAHGRPAHPVQAPEPPAVVPKGAAGYLASGKSLYEANKLDKAIDALQHATQLDPKGASGFYYLGVALQGAHRNDEAKTAFATFLLLEPPESPRHSEIVSVMKHF